MAGSPNVSPTGNGDKRTKFVKQAELRVNKAISALENIIPITDSNQYMYSENDHSAIIGVLNEKIESLSKAFANKGPLAKGFTLDS